MLIVQIMMYIFKNLLSLIPVSTIFSVSVVSSPSMLSSSSTVIFPLLRGLYRNEYIELNVNAYNYVNIKKKLKVYKINLGNFNYILPDQIVNITLKSHFPSNPDLPYTNVNTGPE